MEQQSKKVNLTKEQIEKMKAKKEALVSKETIIKK
jgi:hypothetical protein